MRSGAQSPALHSIATVTYHERDKAKRRTSVNVMCMDRRIRLSIVAVCLFGLGTGACSSVAAYQRGNLAHFTMKPSDASSVGRAHVYAIQEGAFGGEVGAASGCGCN